MSTFYLVAFILSGIAILYVAFFFSNKNISLKYSVLSLVIAVTALLRVLSDYFLFDNQCVTYPAVFLMAMALYTSLKSEVIANRDRAKANYDLIKDLLDKEEDEINEVEKELAEREKQLSMVLRYYRDNLDVNSLRDHVDEYICHKIDELDMKINARNANDHPINVDEYVEKVTELYKDVELEEIFDKIIEEDHKDQEEKEKRKMQEEKELAIKKREDDVKYKTSTCDDEPSESKMHLSCANYEACCDFKSCLECDNFIMYNEEIENDDESIEDESNEDDEELSLEPFAKYQESDEEEADEDDEKYIKSDRDIYDGSYDHDDDDLDDDDDAY